MLRAACLRACFAECLTVLTVLAVLAVVLTAGLVAGADALGEAGTVCADGADGVATEFPLDWAKAGPAISVVAMSAAANFLNMFFSFLLRRRFRHRAVFKHMFKLCRLNGR